MSHNEFEFSLQSQTTADMCHIIFTFFFVTGEDGYGCLWQDCLFVTTSLSEVVRHINFHTFHTNLKSIGAEIVRKTDIRPCRLVIISLTKKTLMFSFDGGESYDRTIFSTF